MIRTASLLAALLLPLPVIAAAATGSDRSSLEIEAGRLGAMMDQSQGLLATLKAVPLPAAPDTPQQDRAQIFEMLVSAVLGYNLVSHQACQAALIDAGLCKGPYLPRWLGGKPASYSDAQLQRMTDEASDRLMPFWDALCAKARAAHAEEPVCPME